MATLSVNSSKSGPEAVAIQTTSSNHCVNNAIYWYRETSEGILTK